MVSVYNKTSKRRTHATHKRLCHTGCEKCKLPVTEMGTRWKAQHGNAISSRTWLEHRGRPTCSWQTRDILCTRILARIGQVLVRQKQISAVMSMSVKNIPCTEMCAYKSDEDNCDNAFSNYSGNSSHTDSSDNEQLHNLNALSRLGISTYYVFLLQSHKTWFTKDIFV